METLDLHLPWSIDKHFPWCIRDSRGRTVASSSSYSWIWATHLGFHPCKEGFKGTHSEEYRKFGLEASTEIAKMVCGIMNGGSPEIPYYAYLPWTSHPDHQFDYRSVLYTVNEAYKNHDIFSAALIWNSAYPDENEKEAAHIRAIEVAKVVMEKVNDYFEKGQNNARV